MTHDVPIQSTKPDLRRLCIVVPYAPTLTETFIRSHIESLPARVVMVHGWRPSIGDRPVLSWPRLAFYKTWRTLSGSSLEGETTAAYLKVFRRYRVEAVLAEYGETGVSTLAACRRAGIPLIVHFHGYDATVRSVLEEHKNSYPTMFGQASAVIAVSRAMQNQLISLGAPPEKVLYNPYGVDCARFGGADPTKSPPILLAVGRFTEKKAPQLTLAAFAQVFRIRPDARLRMVGAGPLLEECKRLAEELGITGAVTFLGGQDHSVVQKEMKHARCFVQHSIEAPSGDCEGTPVGILEAGATGLPVVSTRHAGIPDVVIEERTGFLVEEGDVDAMAQRLLHLVESPELAGQMGLAARAHIQNNYCKDQSLSKLWGIIEACINTGRRTA